MSPDEAEGLPDSIWDAMMRRLEVEIDSIRQATSQTRR
jgi:hypothetical protein